jgi:hypothetical protein
MKILRCSDTEFNALVNLIDAGVRTAGLQCARDAAAVLAVLEKVETVSDEPVSSVDFPEEM